MASDESIAGNFTYLSQYIEDFGLASSLSYRCRRRIAYDDLSTFVLPHVDPGFWTNHNMKRGDLIAWLQAFGNTLAANDVPGVVSCFTTDGYLRDILVLTWRNRTLAGRARIDAYLNDTLKAAAITTVQLDTRAHLTPNTDPQHTPSLASRLVLLPKLRWATETITSRWYKTRCEFGRRSWYS
ncbi:hypothetical protein B0H13DRAFT_2568587 [Mycena leptocephala]|nr:hypothetical protein B0H13DRAFT_2568587 [Mycena leptocephala]